MSQVLVSTKYQVVIPKEVRNDLNIKAGQKMSCIVINGIIHLVPYRPLSSLRGFCKSDKPFNLNDLREKNDRL